jgi:hypothetical protein
MNRTAVKSSHLASVGHDPLTNTLEIEFVNGQVYQYANVSASTHQQIVQASSPGSTFNRYIKSRNATVKNVTSEGV